MPRMLLLPLLLLVQTGCVTLADALRPLQRGFAVQAKDAAAQYHFHWQLSGSPEVAPLQVFDDGRRTWLQFAPGQAVPALFAQSAQGDILLQPVAQGAFQVLDGVWPVLLARGGHFQSHMRRLAPGHDAAAGHPAPGMAVSGQTAQASHSVPGMGESVDGSPRAAVSTAVPAAEAAPATFDPAHSAPVTAVAHPVAPMPVEAPTGQAFEIHPADLTMRAALQRWSAQAGWTFAPEHWAVPVDIPITASARFSLPFLQAVQELMASTELAEQPLQPCFYANRVLRIVPYAQSCDRTLQGNAS